MNHKFSPSQQAAYDAAERGENIFITGHAGCGKSYLTRALTNKDTVVVAPTGIAALNVNGSTCHRVFCLPISFPTPKDKWLVSTNMVNLFGKGLVKRIIISEIGMLRVDMLELIDSKLKKIMRNDLPFGGIQMIVEGDFYQLEPIVSQRDEDMFYSKYTSPFCFTAKCWNFKTYELTHPQRHNNLDHYNLLGQLRVGNIEALQPILDLSQDYVMDKGTLHLCCYNRDADKVNQYWYELIPEQEHEYTAYKEGKISESDVPVPEKLKLKVGCNVLLCANDLSGMYVNGDRGVVVRVSSDFITVKLISGLEVRVDKFTWNTFSYTGKGKELMQEVCGVFTQFPIKLGWAVSIHKAQGTTLDKAAIHTGTGCFSHGQLYVAISRIRDLTNISFIRKATITNNDIIVKPEVIEFYDQ